MKKTTESIVRIMNENYALDISVFSDAFLENIISSRIASESNQNNDQYIRRLTDEPGEALNFRDSLSNSYSTFYRNSLTFSILQQFVLPKILLRKEKTQDNEIRIWSAGCAAGQEAYSLAMLLDEFLNKSESELTFRIFATDNDTQELETARKAVYDFDSVKNLPYRFIRTYLRNDSDTFSINDGLKEYVEFSEYDLLDSVSSSPPASIFGDFDIVMCCNVLFYYKPAFQKLILDKFTRSISPGGFLVTGEAETGIVNSARGFRHYLSPAPLFEKA